MAGCSRKFGVAADELKAAVKAVGNRASDVEKHLKSSAADVRVATWDVNSVRKRLPQLLAWLAPKRRPLRGFFVCAD
jgi:hypothetical protein